MAAATRLEILVGMEVRDQVAYQRYRDGIAPLLEACGGHFRLDLHVGELLVGPPGAPLNRVFVLSFPDAQAKASFFKDPAYLDVKQRHFVAAVGAVEILAEFEHAPEGPPVESTGVD